MEQKFTESMDTWNQHCNDVQKDHLTITTEPRAYCFDGKDHDEDINDLNLSED
jgi:hypothetical protein